VGVDHHLVWNNLERYAGLLRMLEDWLWMRTSAQGYLPVDASEQLLARAWERLVQERSQHFKELTLDEVHAVACAVADTLHDSPQLNCGGYATVIDTPRFEHLVLSQREHWTQEAFATACRDARQALLLWRCGDDRFQLAAPQLLHYLRAKRLYAELRQRDDGPLLPGMTDLVAGAGVASWLLLLWQEAPGLQSPPRALLRFLSERVPQEATTNLLEFARYWLYFIDEVVCAPGADSDEIKRLRALLPTKVA
jgi:hypothetical protein